MTIRGRSIVAAAIAVLLVAGTLAVLAILRDRAPAVRSTEAPSSAGGELPPLSLATGWVGRPLPDDSLLAGPSVVVFWSSTQPRSWRALYEVRAWHEHYGPHGLRVAGVHVPEFAFAADSAHVRRAARRLDLRFPIALDPALRVWSRLKSGAPWPRILLARPGGAVIAEGDERDRARLELEIRSMLRLPRIEPGGVPLAVNFPPPVHLGRARVSRGPLAETTPGKPTLFGAQIRLQIEGAPYVPFPVGRWMLGGDGLTAVRGGAQNFVALRYDAGPLSAIMGPPRKGPARVWVLRDDKWLPRESLGADARLDGRGASYVLVDEARLYEVCRDEGGEHVVKLSPDEPGITVYAFTFEPR